MNNVETVEFYDLAMDDMLCIINNKFADAKLHTYIHAHNN